MLVLASVTDRLVDFATNVVGDLGIAGIFALMVPESACIPIPSEATMLFAGFNVSQPAGAARMPFRRFTLFTSLGCVPWVFMLAFAGKEAGDNWTRWKDGLHYVDYAVLAAIVVGIAYLVLRRRRARTTAAA